ncbi:MAG: HAD family hydrolase [Pirellulaceae bacterium]|nr:HAD family hydrolase [Pirellulaceae bacterium]
MTSLEFCRWPTAEFRAPLPRRPGISHVLFDFDGTLSLIREGWPEVMVGMFVEMLPPLPSDTDESLRQLVLDDIMRLNGKQTIYQMLQLAERVKQRGGEPREPLWYKHEYLRRLEARIAHRTSGIAAGTISRDQYLVHAARPLLDHLRRRGLTLYLASGTDEYAVRREAELLGLLDYFGPHLYGAQDDYAKFSKKMVIDRILHENAIPGEHLLAFGDGYVEIQNTHEVGGFTIAMATDESANGSGNIDPWKRERLLGVGADVVLPDYRDAIGLVDYLLGFDS